MTVLLTGFQAYGGRGLNPAQEIVQALDGSAVEGHTIRGCLLPVSAGQLTRALDTAIGETEPQVVLSLGLWPGEAVIRLEHLAVNWADFEIPDNDGALLRRTPLAVAGPPARWATLPVTAIVDALLQAGIPARASTTAGTFLCNATLYTALGLLAEAQPAPPCGFLHVPYLPQQIAMLLQETRQQAQLECHQRADWASMALDTMVEAVGIALATTLTLNES
ncbi:MAG: pyroglutamyl-peptidase I [Candidatus Competibacterales bacterium]